MKAKKEEFATTERSTTKEIEITGFDSTSGTEFKITVTAKVNGPIAMFRDGRRYRVIHIPTNKIVCYFPGDKIDAEAGFRQLARLDWSNLKSMLILIQAFGNLKKKPGNKKSKSTA